MRGPRADSGQLPQACSWARQMHHQRSLERQQRQPSLQHSRLTLSRRCAEQPRLPHSCFSLKPITILCPFKCGCAPMQFLLYPCKFYCAPMQFLLYPCKSCCAPMQVLLYHYKSGCAPRQVLLYPCESSCAPMQVLLFSCKFGCAPASLAVLLQVWLCT